MIETRNQLKHYDEIMERAHGFKYHNCEPELRKTTSLTMASPAKDDYQASTNYLKFHIDTVIESEA